MRNLTIRSVYELRQTNKQNPRQTRTVKNIGIGIISEEVMVLEEISSFRGRGGGFKF